MDNVNHPPHYNFGKIEVLEAIEAWELGSHLANTVKYCARAGRKDPTKVVEDLRKAHFYLERKIHLEACKAKGIAPLRPDEMNLVCRKCFLEASIAACCQNSHAAK